MNLLQPHRQAALALPPLTYIQSEIEPEEVIALYCSLSASERAARFVSTVRVAKDYGVSQRTLQHWIEYGWIAAVKVGRNYKVDQWSVRQLFSRAAA